MTVYKHIEKPLTNTERVQKIGWKIVPFMVDDLIFEGILLTFRMLLRGHGCKKSRVCHFRVAAPALNRSAALELDFEYNLLDSRRGVVDGHAGCMQIFGIKDGCRAFGENQMR